MSSKHRWCVTGTPFTSDNVTDLVGQLMVLKATPYCFPAIFNNRFVAPLREKASNNSGFGLYLVRGLGSLWLLCDFQ
jgi:hypothetical protein